MEKENVKKPYVPVPGNETFRAASVHFSSYSLVT